MRRYRPASTGPRPNLFFVSAFLLVLLYSPLLIGCAQNTVPLVYSSPAENTLPIAGAPSVCVVAFTDQRFSPPIGQRSDGTDFMPQSDVSAWFTQALGTEIAREGIVVTRAASEAEAKSSHADYIVTGTVDEVWLTEKSSTEYETRLRSTLVIKSGQKNLFSRSFSSSLSRRVVPGSSVPKELLTESLSDLVTPMARAVYEKVHR